MAGAPLIFGTQLIQWEDCLVLTVIITVHRMVTVNIRSFWGAGLAILHSCPPASVRGGGHVAPIFRLL